MGNTTGAGYSTTDPNIGFGLYVSAVGNATVGTTNNGIIGMVNNNVAYSVNPSLSVGTTGYGKVPNGTASIAYGLYGLAELFNQYGIAVNEVTTRNFSGANADIGIPPSVGLPTTHAVNNALQVSCGSIEGPSEWDCSTGLYITNESGGDASKPSFANGEIIQGYRNFGLYILAQPSLTQTSALFENNGNGVNLQLKTTLTETATNAVLTITDMSGTVHGALFQNGDSHGNNLLFTGNAQALSGLPSGAGGGGLYVCVDNTGILYKKSACP